MTQFRVLPALMGAATLAAALAMASIGPTRVGPSDTDWEPQSGSNAEVMPLPVHPIAAPYGGSNYVATPEIISRVGEILGAIDSPQRRTELAEQWLKYARQVIDKDLEFRRQWLDLERAQLSQQQAVEQLRLEVARLQLEIEQLRARNAQLERENLQTPSRPGLGSDGSSSGPAPRLCSEKKS